MTIADAIPSGPSPLAEFALGLVAVSGDPLVDARVRRSRAELAAWIRFSLAGEQSLLARAEEVGADVAHRLDRGAASAEDQQRLRQFAIATRAALTQYTADREIDRQLAEVVAMSIDAGVADTELVDAQSERAAYHVHAAARWGALADLLEDVSDVLAVLEAREQQGSEPPRPWPDVKRDLGLG